MSDALYRAAAIDRDVERTRMLLEQGADPNEDEVTYHTPETYDNACLRLLVGSDKLTTESLTTILARKLDWHDLDAIVWLLDDPRTDPNAISRWGRRALHQALERNNRLRFFELLLDHRADPAQLDRNGRSVFMMAARGSRADVLDLFTARGHEYTLDDGDRLLSACAHKYGDEARAMVAAQPSLVASIEARDPWVLAEAAGAGDVDVIALMLDLGFDIASRTSRADSQDNTALHLAVWRGRAPVAKLLIDRGAPLDAKNKKNKTPLEWAEYSHAESPWFKDRPPIAEVIDVLRSRS